MIVGLSGYAQAGKDTAAEQLAPHGFVRAAFADKLKALAYAMNPAIHGVPLATIVDARGWDSAKRIPAVRTYLQNVGLVHREVLGPNVWVDALFDNLPELRPGQRDVVITDVRFPNEAAAVRSSEGILIRITRPGVGPVNGHTSESALDDYLFDAVVANDGTPEQLGERLRQVIRGD